MMSGLAYCLILAGSAGAALEAVETPDTVESTEPTVDEASTPSDPVVDESVETEAKEPAIPRRRRSRRTEADLGCWPARDCLDPGAANPGVPRPRLLNPRSKWGAATLGFVVGLGSGFYYAGDDVQGTAFAVTDAVLWTGFVATTIAFTQLVVDNDFRTEKSLRRNERSFGEREGRLYTAVWILGLAQFGSHLYQGLASYRAAKKTNGVLRDFTFVPLGDGAGATLRIGW